MPDPVETDAPPSPVSEEPIGPTAGRPGLEELLQMARFNALYPATEPFLQKRQAVVHLHPHVRLRIGIEQCRDPGHGLWRSELLAEAGIFCAEHDSKAFAENLVSALRDDLSLRNLQDLSIAFTEELQRETERRRVWRECEAPRNAAPAAAPASTSEP